MFKKKISVFYFFMMFLMSTTLQAQLDDPTRPPGYRLVVPGVKKVVTRFSLSSVRISSARRSAIVNEQTVETGDMVDGAKVVAIYPSAVKLNKQGKIFTVELVSRVMKKIRIR